MSVALTVSALTAQIKDTLEGGFPRVLVSGEISDIARPSSGHVYLTLKDPRAQLRAVAWRTTAQRLSFQPRNGQEVICEGHLDVYPPRGGYQLVIRRMEPLGVGDLQQKLRELQRRLAAEGCFDPQRKRPLPAFVRHVVVVTSPTGAAVQDFLEVSRRRWPGVRITVAPVRVQGEGAAREIVAMLRRLHRMRPACDVIVITRGGGSVEDLWCFNEEPLVKAVAACRIPVVSAVGHEVDVTLCDLAADVRALTPSEAAERVLPSAADLAEQLDLWGRRLAAGVRGRVDRSRAQLESVLQRRPLRRPLDELLERSRHLDQLQLRAQRAVEGRLRHAGQRMAAAAGRLQSLSPLAVLARGYAVALDQQDRLIPDAAALEPGQLLRLRFRDGQADVEVQEVEVVDSRDHRSARIDAGDDDER